MLLFELVRRSKVLHLLLASPTIFGITHVTCEPPISLSLLLSVLSHTLLPLSSPFASSFPLYSPCSLTHSSSPLMSIASTLQLTVKQKARFGRNTFVGCLGIQLNHLPFWNKPLKKWYKLRSQPGKLSTKLRGKVLVTVQLQSRWN